MSSDQTSTAWHIRNNEDTQQAILDLITGSPSDLPYATELAPGVVELATVVEAEAGVADNLAVTPEGLAAAIAAAPGGPTTALDFTEGADGVIYLDDAAPVGNTATLILANAVPAIPSGTKILFCSVYAAITPGTGGSMTVTQTLPGDDPEIYRRLIGATEAGVTFGCTLTPDSDQVVLSFSAGAMAITYVSVNVVAFI